MAIKLMWETIEFAFRVLCFFLFALAIPLLALGWVSALAYEHAEEKAKGISPCDESLE